MKKKNLVKAMLLIWFCVSNMGVNFGIKMLKRWFEFEKVFVIYYLQSMFMFLVTLWLVQQQNQQAGLKGLVKRLQHNLYLLYKYPWLVVFYLMHGLFQIQAN